MKTTIWMGAILAAVAAFGPLGCGDDDDTTGGGDADTDTDTDTDTDADSDADAGTGENGDWCDQNEDCLSGFCQTFVSVPADPEGSCQDGLPAGQIRIMGNLRDFYTGEYLAGTQFKVTGAMTALMNPTGAEALLTPTTDGDGLFDVTGGEDVTSASVGLVSVAEADGYYLTITGLVEPELEGDIYPPGIRNHDVRIVPLDKLDEWSSFLAAYEELDAFLPLGTTGAVVGTISYVDTGAGVPGAALQSTLGDSSVAKIYYLNEAEDGFNQEATGSRGIFILFQPSLAEKFDAVVDGEIVSRLSATMGQTANAIYNNTVQVEGGE